MRRRVSNWLNYREPGQDWQPSTPGAAQAQGAPPAWSGAFDFSHQSHHAPLQCYFRDAMDAGNRAMVGCRISERPGCWLNIKALDCTSADAVIEDGGAAVRWPSLWPQADLVYRPGRHKLAKELHLHAPGHPLAFEFSVRLAAGHALEFVGGGARVLDIDGAEVLRLPSPWAHDSATTGLGPDGHQQIGVTMTEGDSRRIGGVAYRTIRLEVSADDLASAVYPVWVDPTVTVSGTTDIEETRIQSNAGNSNFGGDTVLYFGYSSRINSLVRIAAGALPCDTITGFGMTAYWWSSLNLDIDAYHVVDVNSWVEGTAGAAAQAGSACWNQAKYTVQNWAGGANGCGISGNDFDADANPPSIRPPSTGWHTISLPVQWATEWVSGARATNGFVMIERSGAAGYPACYTTEHATLPLYFEVDYEAAAAGKGRIVSALRRRIA